MKARSLSAAIAWFAVVLAACTGGASPSPAASASSQAPASAPAASSPSATAAPSLTGSEYSTIKPLKPAVDLNTAQIDQIIGVKGQANGGVYQLVVPRRDLVTENGMQLTPPGPLGVNTAIGFQPTGGGKAAITGDFVLIGTEVPAVIKELKAAGIEVTAIHSHMLTEQPRLIFMHFWANDDAMKLARGLRAALDKTAVGKS